MKLFTQATNRPCTHARCAREILEIVPMIMHAIRAHVRLERRAGLSVPQFRSLIFLTHEPGASLSELREFVGLAMPSTSKLVNGLLTRGLLSRRADARDRRRIALELTGHGRRIVQQAAAAAQERLAELLGSLGADERKAVSRALGMLRPLFEGSRTCRRGHEEQPCEH